MVHDTMTDMLGPNALLLGIWLFFSHCLSHCPLHPTADLQVLLLAISQSEAVVHGEPDMLHGCRTLAACRPGGPAGTASAAHKQYRRGSLFASRAGAGAGASASAPVLPAPSDTSAASDVCDPPPGCDATSMALLRNSGGWPQLLAGSDLGLRAGLQAQSIHGQMRGSDGASMAVTASVVDAVRALQALGGDALASALLLGLRTMLQAQVQPGRSGPLSTSTSASASTIPFAGAGGGLAEVQAELAWRLGSWQALPPAAAELGAASARPGSEGRLGQDVSGAVSAGSLPACLCACLRALSLHEPLMAGAALEASMAGALQRLRETSVELVTGRIGGRGGGALLKDVHARSMHHACITRRPLRLTCKCAAAGLQACPAPRTCSCACCPWPRRHAWCTTRQAPTATGGMCRAPAPCPARLLWLCRIAPGLILPYYDRSVPHRPAGAHSWQGPAKGRRNW